LAEDLRPHLLQFGEQGFAPEFGIDNLDVRQLADLPQPAVHVPLNKIVASILHIVSTLSQPPTDVFPSVSQPFLQFKKLAILFVSPESDTIHIGLITDLIRLGSIWRVSWIIL